MNADGSPCTAERHCEACKAQIADEAALIVRLTERQDREFERNAARFEEFVLATCEKLLASLPGTVAAESDVDK